jgi:hypothetical protein
MDKYPDGMALDINRFIGNVLKAQADASALATAFIKISMTKHYVYKDRPVYVTYH